MTTQSEFSYPRYLAAKQSVDDRALNRQVFAALAQALAPHQASGSLAFLEVGCGIGTMVERLWDWEILVNADYTGVDLLPANIAAAQTRPAGFRSGTGFRTWGDGGTRLAFNEPRTLSPAHFGGP